MPCRSCRFRRRGWRGRGHRRMVMLRRGRGKGTLTANVEQGTPNAERNGNTAGNWEQGLGNRQRRTASAVPGRAPAYSIETESPCGMTMPPAIGGGPALRKCRLAPGSTGRTRTGKRYAAGRRDGMLVPAVATWRAGARQASPLSERRRGGRRAGLQGTGDWPWTCEGHTTPCVEQGHPATDSLRPWR